jgi:hypothetical protein
MATKDSLILKYNFWSWNSIFEHTIAHDSPIPNTLVQFEKIFVIPLEPFNLKHSSCDHSTKYSQKTVIKFQVRAQAISQVYNYFSTAIPDHFASLAVFEFMIFTGLAPI